MTHTAQDFLKTTEIAGVLDDHEPEMTLIWRADNVWCRARPDAINRRLRVMLHYKTTQGSAQPDAFIRGIMESGGYDVAMAFYSLGARAVGLDDWQHVLLAQEQAFPHACSLISLDPAKWGIADAKVDRALVLWEQCVRTNRWPGYSSQIHYASPTPWQLAEAEAML